MSEKYRVDTKVDTSAALPAPSVSGPTKGKRVSLVRAGALLLGGAITSLLLTTYVPPFTSISTTPAVLSDDVSAFAINWERCPPNKDGTELDRDRFDCATYEVPLDWSKQGKHDAGVVKLAVIRYKVEKGVKRLGSLFTNP
jgi:hypothetical protein